MTLVAEPPVASYPAYPAVLEPQPVAEVQGTWWAAYVKSRQEKAFAEDLSELGIPNYLPLSERRSVVNGRRTTIQVPTFTGYAFFATRGRKGDDCYADDVYTVRGNSRIVQWLEIRDQKLFVKELAQIQKSLEIDPSLGTCMYLVPGSRVRVVKGPFMGFEGVLERHSKGRFHLVLSVMQASREVEMPDETYMEPLD